MRGVFISELIVDSEEVLVRHFGMCERIIVSEDVAVGASLPELVASKVAAFKKETNIAIGNLTDSNVLIS